MFQYLEAAKMFCTKH